MKVVIDLGNSEMRAYIEKISDGSCKSIQLPNYFVEFAKDESIKKEDDNVFSIKSCEGLVSPRIEIPIRVGTGKTVDIQYSERIERPGFIDKVLQRNTYYSIIYTIINAMNYNGINTGEVELTLLLPLKEVDKRAQELIDSVNGLYELEWEGLEYKVNVTVANIVGEDQAAVIATFYDMDGKLIPEMAEYKKGDLIAIDIGAGTLNVVCFKNLTFIEGKKDTFDIGGNTVRELFIDKYEQSYGFKPNIENAEQACRTGWIKQGTKSVDVTDLVNVCRKEVARSSESILKRFFARVRVNLSEVPLFLYLGGNAIKGPAQANGKELKPIAEYLQDLLKPITPYGLHLIPEDARNLNVRGGWIYAKIMDKMKRK